MSRLTKPNLLQTLDRGLQILELLAAKEHRPTEISRALGLDRTAVHRLLRTLMQRGFVERIDASGHYRANFRRLLALTGDPTTQHDENWLAFARSQLEELRAKTGLSANLCMPSDKGMVYLMQILGGEGLAVNSPPGTRRPFHCSAVGKAYLGSLPEPELDAVLATLEMRPLTPHTISSAAKLKRHLSEARRNGYYTDDGEFDPQIRCVAAPILDRFGRSIASIGVSGPSEDPAFERMAELGALAAEKARRISLVLGYDATRRTKPSP